MALTLGKAHYMVVTLLNVVLVGEWAMGRKFRFGNTHGYQASTLPVYHHLF